MIPLQSCTEVVVSILTDDKQNFGDLSNNSRHDSDLEDLSGLLTPNQQNQSSH